MDFKSSFGEALVHESKTTQQIDEESEFPTQVDKVSKFARVLSFTSEWIVEEVEV